MSDQALTRLAESTAQAVLGVLRTYLGEDAAAEGVAVARDSNPLESLPLPLVLASVSYVDGVQGGNVLVLSVDGARALAARMMGAETPQDTGGELEELELSAVSEAMNQMMAAAAAATSAVIGQEVDISPPRTSLLTAIADAEEIFAAAPHQTVAGLTVAGHPCRLVQLVPNAFVVRMTRALDELSAEYASEGGEGGVGSAAMASALRDIDVRVWAELGRSEMGAAAAAALPSGAIVELDSQVDDLVELYVNGRRFAAGTLLLDGSEWAVRIEEVFLDPEIVTTARGAVE